MEVAEKYGKELVPADGPIPAQLLGNLWAQDWTNIYPLLRRRRADPGYDLTAILNRERTSTPVGMVHYGEQFFVSLGFEPLPATFWERSMFMRPRDRDVVCHASAWDIDYRDDLRVKVCIEHEGRGFHDDPPRAGAQFLPARLQTSRRFLQNGANDGFHEAIGDTIALSVTPEYLKEIGLLDTVPAPIGGYRALAEACAG